MINKNYDRVNMIFQADHSDNCKRLHELLKPTTFKRSHLTSNQTNFFSASCHEHSKPLLRIILIYD